MLKIRMPENLLMVKLSLTQAFFNFDSILLTLTELQNQKDIVHIFQIFAFAHTIDYMVDGFNEPNDCIQHS